jgi:transposase-like protein
MVRNSVRFVPYKDRKAVVEGLKKIYPAPPADLAPCAPDGFAGVRDKKYPVISKSWRSRRNGVIPFFRFSPETRKAVYTAKAMESVNYTIRKTIRHRQSFPNDGAAMKPVFTGLKKIAQKRTMPVRDWGAAPINLRSFTGKIASPYDVPIYYLHNN